MREQMKSWIALVGLRYRLAWAGVRSRNGRTVLLVAGYLAVAAAMLLFALGGFSVAAAAVRLGQANAVVAVVLTALCLNIAFVSVFVGINTHVALSESALRRYPLSHAGRLIATHVTALLEPLWIVTLALTLGLAGGLSVNGTGLAWTGVPAAALIVLATYLLGSLVTRLGEWMLARRGGILLAIVVGVGLMIAAPLVPVWLMRASARSTAIPLRAVLDLTPSFAAARAMTDGVPSAALGGLAIVIAWCGALAVLLIGANHLPRRARTLSAGPAQWDHPADRAGAMFGSDLAPLAAKMVRYFIRSPQTRYNYPLALPVLAAMIAANARNGGDAEAFLFALGAAPAIGILATGTLSMNLFGFDGHGFRRYFLLPVRPVAVVRVATLVNLMPGMVLMLLGILAWWALSPEPVTLPMAVMLGCAAFGGLFLFNALGLWTSIMAPRAIPFAMTFGNKLSPAANVVFVGAMVVFFGLPLALRGLGAGAVLGAWWIAPLFLAAATVFQLITVNVGARTFIARREQMLAAIEGH